MKGKHFISRFFVASHSTTESTWKFLFFFVIFHRKSENTSENIPRKSHILCFAFHAICSVASSLSIKIYTKLWLVFSFLSLLSFLRQVILFSLFEASIFLLFVYLKRQFVWFLRRFKTKWNRSDRICWSL